MKECIGTRWVCVAETYASTIYNSGDSGTIRSIDEEMVGLEFDRDIGGHDLSGFGPEGLCEYGHGWWIAKDTFFDMFSPEFENLPDIKYSFDDLLAGENAGGEG